MTLRQLLRLVSLILALCLLSGCAGAADGTSPPTSQPDSTPAQQTQVDGSDSEEEDEGPYIAPPMLESGFHEDLAEGNGSVFIDLSAVGEGVVAVSARSESRLKFQVIMGDVTYNYDIASDGSPSVFPLQSGNGNYRFRVMENVVDNKYAELYAADSQVELLDEYQPFLRPSDYASYDSQSECVRKAAELAQTAGTPLGLVKKVYGYVCKNVTYDYELAATVQSGYLPTPDKTLSTGKGICFDYASLSAAMLRSQGIPTEIVFGYVAPDDLYHAWNMFYTEETGWVAVEFKVQGESWVRLDLTFAANGSDNSFIGDGSNYADVYYF